MSNSKHTPGPWRWTANYEPAELEIDIGTYESPGYWGNPTLMAGDVCVVGCDEYWILGGDKYDPDGRANARLIAAAPDLLEALKELLELIRQEYTDPRAAALEGCFISRIARAQWKKGWDAVVKASGA